MKANVFLILVCVVLTSCNTKKNESTSASDKPAETTASGKALFIDVHNLEPGKVTFEGVADAHKKDLATQDKFGVSFIKYWVDESAGKVYCLAESKDSASMAQTHAEAHGLIPDHISQVSEGQEAAIRGNSNLYMDVHNIGPGKVTAAAVADAHVKDLATQSKYNVNFVDYWVDEKLGVVMCLAEAPDEQALIKTHTEAHGLVPNEVHKVKQGQ